MENSDVDKPLRFHQYIRIAKRLTVFSRHIHRDSTSAALFEKCISFIAAVVTTVCRKAY